MNQEKLFFQIYQNLENDLLEMSDFIHFGDENLQVYSVKLLEFSLTCNTEIESLFREIYSRNTKGKPKSVGINEMFRNVVEKNRLVKKQVRIMSNRFYFVNDYSDYFAPLSYEKEGANLSQIYNSLKHERAKNIHKATLEVAINNLALLFILNVYFGNSTYQNLYMRRDNFAGQPIFSSKIFELKVAQLSPLIFATLFAPSDSEKIQDYLNQSAYYIWYDWPYMIEKEQDGEIISSLKHIKEVHLNKTNEDIVLENDSNYSAALLQNEECSQGWMALEFGKSIYLNEGIELTALRDSLLPKLMK